MQGNNSNMIFSERIKTLRKSKKITQKDMAEMIGVKPGTFAGYENYGNYPEVANLIKIADKLDVSIDYLLGREYCTGNNSGFAPFMSDEADILGVLKLNKFKPRYIRVKDPERPVIDYKYYLPQKKHLDIFDPFEEREKSGDIRIYLKFVNSIQHTDAMHQEYYINEFLNQYGFIGENEGIYSNSLLKALRLDQNIIYPNYITEKSLERLNIFENDLLNYSRPNYETGFGYYESSSFIYHRFIRDFENRLLVLQNLTYFPDFYKGSIYDHSIQEEVQYVNMGLYGIVPYCDVIDNKVVFSFGYQSLISLMYLELLFDIRNNIIPGKCVKCYQYFLPQVRSINEPLICPNCLI